MKRRRNQRGSALLVTLIVISALLAGGAMLMSLQVSSAKASDFTRSGMTSLYCAEAGLSAARAVVAQNYGLWRDNAVTPDALCTTFRTNPDACAEPAFLSAALGAHDLDGDGTADFAVFLHDNDDEGGINDLSKDNDLEVWIVAKCLKSFETPTSVSELVLFNGGVSCIGNMSGGPDGDGNSNGGC